MAGRWKVIKQLHRSLSLENLDSPAHTSLKTFGELTLIELCHSLGERSSQEGMLHYKVEVQDNIGMGINLSWFRLGWQIN